MSKIIDFVKVAYSAESNVPNIEFDLGKIPNYQGQLISQITGVKCNGLQKVLTSYAVRHIHKRHGNDVEEKARGQIGVTESDYEYLHEILTSPDEIKKGAIVERNKQSILFCKRISCTYFVALVIEGGKNNQKLHVKTMYKKG